VSTRLKRFSILILLLLFIGTDVGIGGPAVYHPDTSRTAPILASSNISFCTATHDANKVGLLMTNGGLIGVGDWFEALSSYSADSSSCHLGSVVPLSDWYAGEYPLGSGNKCLGMAGLWVGAVIQSGDTLVSSAWDADELNFELYPAAPPSGTIVHRSLLDPADASEARSDQDYVAVYTDTVVRGVSGLKPDWATKRPHLPLGLRITQTSCAWSNHLVDDFILVEYSIENIGTNVLHDAYVGFYLTPAFDHMKETGIWPSDDVTGFLDTFPATQGCGWLDTLNIAWSSDNNGNPQYTDVPPIIPIKWLASGPDESVLDVTGVTILQTPKGSEGTSYNWWAFHYGQQGDYGPQHNPGVGRGFRRFGTGGTGSPLGDADRYFVMSNGEIDPDQPRILEIQPGNPDWVYPTEDARSYLFGGASPEEIVSAGPFRLERGEEKSFVVAFIGGQKFHSDIDNGTRLFAGDVDGWYAHLDFSDLAKNANMARWVFDNPGFDTDGDGNAGKFRVCVLDSALVNGHWSPTVAETTYYTGDGVPDWRSVGPPPAPKFWTYPTLHGLRLRFNGKLSETTKDLVTNRIDFEGYRVYCGLDEREASLALVASYDREDFDKYWYNPRLLYGNGFVKTQQPFTLERLRCLYGKSPDPCADSSFDPLQYTALSPLRFARFPDSAFYFLPHDYNADKFGKTTSIKKIFPEAKLPKPGDSLGPDDLTPDGYAKYYEYEVTIPGLLPTMQWFVNVSAFDYGDPAMDIDPLESSRILGLQTGYALADSNQMGGTLPPVYVYPNPYYGDGRYRDQGLEGRTDFRSDDRVRRICFVNVPAKCTVNILTLDGDLVRAIPHDIDPSNANAHHEYWDMINKNHQTVVSGLYYWAVEGADGKVQIGKFVIIR
jgi:hypothetical protein